MTGISHRTSDFLATLLSVSPAAEGTHGKSTVLTRVPLTQRSHPSSLTHVLGPHQLCITTKYRGKMTGRGQ